MAKIISKCPRCKTTNKVKNTIFMRLDMGTGVTCSQCNLRFHAILAEKDVEQLFEEGSVSPIVKGDEDYLLESEYYPNP
ncbi:MAG: hypothetical protein HFJ57_02040 [Clostridia bacterium]|nr:hypothetical protein [Clostridia bacterium]